MPRITDDDLRTAFHEACAERDAIIERSRPLREQRDAIREQMRPLEAQERELNEQIAEVESGLFGVQNEIGAMNRALKGKTGSAPPEQTNAESDGGSI